MKSNSQSEKGTESQNYFRTQIEQFELNAFRAASIWVHIKIENLNAF
jgi:hypothetical protein